MSRRDCTFHDSYWYCYANSAAMLLSSIGEHVSPRLIEALTGVGLGASFNPPLPFFGQLQPPDLGLSQALEQLGFGFDEDSTEQADPAPLERLAQVPAIVGPIDMSHLVYNPMRPREPGVDHYVVILEAQDGRYRLHDPAGFAHVPLDAANLATAWRADAISYRRGHYRSWTNPRRLRTPDPDAIYEAGMVNFQHLYREADRRAERNGERIGREALLALATTVATGALTPQQRGHLIFFGLPLGTKRALDYVAFFEKRAPQLADLKRRQALAFGACQAALTAGASTEAARQLGDLAVLEPEIKDAILHA
jgi:hypothetical protein